ncbi:MAG: DnaJ domain-containing protein [Deltaproteobacteria bacterium]
MDEAQQLLSMSSDADRVELRRMYVRLARTCHPDVDRSPGAAERFKRLSQAYRQRLATPPRERREARAETGALPRIQRVMAVAMQRAMGGSAGRGGEPVTLDVEGVRVTIRFR